MGLGEQVPEAVETAKGCSNAKMPDDRPKSAEELALRLRTALGSCIMPVRSGVPTVTAPASGTNLLKVPASALPVPRVTTRNTMQHSVEAVMPEAMAMLKLKGFIFDLGGVVIESIPGMIFVCASATGSLTEKKSGLFDWLNGGDAAAKSSVLEAATSAAVSWNCRMERREPSQPNKLTITLVIVPGRGLVTSEWHSKCKKIGLDLKAYLMGRVNRQIRNLK